DSLLVKAGSGVATLGLTDSPGVPRALAELTITAPYNDVGALDEVFRVHRNQLAAAIVEPVAGNMGCVPPRPGFLERLRDLTAEPVTDYASARKSDTAAFGRFFRMLLDRGVYFPPSQFEAAFVSAAHTAEDLALTLAAARRAFAGMG